MARPDTRAWKRALAAAEGGHADGNMLEAARASALLLLARSVAMGHSRLAVLRLLAAARVEAEIPSGHWSYCQAQANSSPDSQIRSAYLEAERLRGAKTQGGAPRRFTVSALEGRPNGC
ncbi:MAG: hypothetical protein KIT17_14280 [Rubrivivax sp.]|nr:hypothetical protein [Rubrivivax sp.]